MIDRSVLRERAAQALRRTLSGSGQTPPTPTPDQADAELIEKLHAALRRMPMLTREVFLLHRLEDLSYTRIAHRLSISVEEVERHMSRALYGLCRELSDAD